MLSVIIPSLFKIERFYKTLQELSNCNEVGEIVVIDNTGIEKKLNIPKLNYIIEPENTFINPAWNKGVSLAKYDKLCIMNDDIWFNFNYLTRISEFINSRIGMIGMSEDNYNTPKPNFSISKKEKLEGYPKGKMNYGYACCFFMHKSNWINIPEEIKLLGGDDYLFYYNNGLDNYVINGIHCKGSISGTLDNPSLINHFYPIKLNDLKEIEKLISSNVLLKGNK